MYYVINYGLRIKSGLGPRRSCMDQIAFKINVYQHNGKQSSLILNFMDFQNAFENADENAQNACNYTYRQLGQ